MTDNDSEQSDASEQDTEDVAKEAASNRDELLSLLPHYYRGEISQAGKFLDRLDLTVDWAIALVTAVLALAFESVESSPYLLLIGMVAISMFLVFDVRRYRMYDAIRARVRLIEENVYANAFDPSDTQLAEWREELGDDLRRPMLKVTYWEALSRRLERVYFLLYLLLGVAWLFRITIFAPKETWHETASVPGVSGEIVVTVVGVFYLVVTLLTFWPHRREAKGEFHGEEAGDWKEME